METAPEVVAPIIVFGVWGVAILVGLALLVFWVWALVDCIRREFPGQNDKLIWILVIVLVGWLGALIYLFAGRPKSWLPGESPPPAA